MGTGIGFARAGTGPRSRATESGLRVAYRAHLAEDGIDSVQDGVRVQLADQRGERRRRRSHLLDRPDDDIGQVVADPGCVAPDLVEERPSGGGGRRIRQWRYLSLYGPHQPGPDLGTAIKHHHGWFREAFFEGPAEGIMR